MHVRWTDEAIADLDDIVDFIETDSPTAAQKVAVTIVDAAESLMSMPHRGRPGSRPGTRELVLHPLEYIITYEVIRDGVFILRIHHGAQSLPRR
jgi:addiction module RelE/StbE family toxin